MHKDLRKLVKQIEAKGNTVQRTKGGHYKVKDREGRTRYSLPSTPGGGRWLQNVTADLRREGLID